MELCDKGLRWNMYESCLVYSSNGGVYLCNKPPQGNGFEKTLIARVNLLFINPSPTLKSAKPWA